MIVDAMPKKAKNTVWDLELSIFFDHQVATPDTDINNNISSIIYNHCVRLDFIIQTVIDIYKYCSFLFNYNLKR